MYIQAFAEPGLGDPQSWLIENLLSQALEHINDLIRRQGDGLLEGGAFHFVRDGVELFSYNGNNHQLTRGVMRSAIKTIIDFCKENGGFGYSAFGILDGINQVGQGVLRPDPRIA